MPASDGQKEAAAALLKHGEHPTCRGASFTEEKKQAPIFIVASPRPQVGKTFVARLLVDFQRLGHDDPVVFDLNPRGDALKGEWNAGPDVGREAFQFMFPAT